MSFYIFLAIGWIGYFFMHSLLASNRVKNSIKRHARGLAAYYRIFYVVFALVGLIALLAWGARQNEFLFERTPTSKYVSLMLAGVGVVIIRLAFRNFDLKSFVGIKAEDRTFHREGILNYVRHPTYAGTILIVVGFFVFTATVSSIVTVMCFLLYIPIGIVLEERKLVSEFGDQYTQYRREVPALFPMRFKNK